MVGIDEVGRGPIAGPVAVGVFLMDKKHQKLLKGIKDSKALGKKGREIWHKKILELKKQKIVDFKVSYVSSEIIDKKGIAYSIRFAMQKSLSSLKISPQKVSVLLDGSLYAPMEYKYQKTIIKGDEKEIVIAAASVVAKISRDALMEKLAKKYPKYPFEKHKGYGTKAHYSRVKKHGFSKIHRRSFLKGIS